MDNIKSFFAKDSTKMLAGIVLGAALFAINKYITDPDLKNYLYTTVVGLGVYLGITSGGTSSLRSNASNNATAELVGQGIVSPSTSVPKPPTGFVRLLLLVVLVIGALSFAFAARAQTPSPSPANPSLLQPKFGGCLASGQTCFGPSVSISLVSIDLKSGSVTTGVMPGVGYGAVFFADQWYRAGVAGYTSFRDTADGQRMVGSLVFSFAEYLRLGVGRQFGPSERFFGLLGIGSEFGSVPTAKP